MRLLQSLTPTPLLAQPNPTLAKTPAHLKPVKDAKLHVTIDKVADGDAKHEVRCLVEVWCIVRAHTIRLGLHSSSWDRTPLWTVCAHDRPLSTAACCPHGSRAFAMPLA